MRRASSCPSRAADGHAARGGRRDVTVVREHGKVLLSNDRVRVALDAADGRWDATWRGGADAAVWRDRFSVEVGGRLLSPQAAKTETAPARDVARQRHGNPRALGPRSRAGTPHSPLPRPPGDRAARPRSTNQTAHDVTLGRVRMIDVAGALGGGWRLADARQPPAAVGFPARAPACRPRPTKKRARRCSSTAAWACWRCSIRDRRPRWCSAPCRPGSACL